MAAPTTEVIPVEYQNPHATTGLKLNLVVVSNTSDEVIDANVKANAAKYTNWLQQQEAHDGSVVIIGGGDSINDHIADIKNLQLSGATVYALNGASRWARDHGIDVDYQVILDAKEETAMLVDEGAKGHYFASQCDPKTTEKAPDLILWHLASQGVEDNFPPERVKKGGYVLVGGESTVGTCAMCLAYTQGYRDLHLFGFDSSYREGNSHGYEQRINATMPTTMIRWADKEYQVSIAMKRQALRFPLNAKALEILGCKLHVYGEGFLQTVYRTNFNELSEQQKYQTMWLYDAYREVSPGENIADTFMAQFSPKGEIIDFGCGTGRSSLKFEAAGLKPILVDFADNCRDQEALHLPFMVHDLTRPLTIYAGNGYCTDVMEHIPTKDVETVVKNIMDAAEKVFFQISTVDDHFGAVFNEPLHLTVKPHKWWKKVFQRLGYKIKYDTNLGNASIFYIDSNSRKKAP